MSRLTYKDLASHSGIRNGKTLFDKVYNKLGQIEDILEEYGIEDLTDLKIALDYYNHRYDGGIYTERVDKYEQH